MLAGIAGSNIACGMSVCFREWLNCQVEIYATSWSLFCRSGTECGVSERDREALALRMLGTAVL